GPHAGHSGRSICLLPPPGLGVAPTRQGGGKRRTRTFDIRHDRPPEPAVVAPNLAQRASAQAAQAIHLVRAVRADVDVHPVPDTFGSGTRLKPDARACARRWLDFHVYPHGDGSVPPDPVVRWW